MLVRQFTGGNHRHRLRHSVVHANRAIDHATEFAHHGLVERERDALLNLDSREPTAPSTGFALARGAQPPTTHLI